MGQAGTALPFGILVVDTNSPDLRPCEAAVHARGGEAPRGFTRRRYGDQPAISAKGLYFRQHAVDVVYRFFQDEALFVGARYNKVSGDLVGIADRVGAKRVQLSGGWFITPALLAKIEYVNQKYFGYPSINKLNGGRFNGLMAEGVVAF